MLITLRNSGAKGIQYTKVIDDDILKSILEDSENNSHVVDVFLKSKDLDSFIIPQNTIPTLLHLEVNESSWHGTDSKRYTIILEYNKSHYRLYYEGGTKPDFFKNLFQYFYPDQAEKQIEEMV